jgi:hypothetical protein
MDIQLKELIETIKQDGIASAEAKGAEIIKEAEEKAKQPGFYRMQNGKLPDPNRLPAMH